MSHIYKVVLSDLLSDLPNITNLVPKKDFSNIKDHLFICALGFEDRCYWIADALADSNYRCGEAIIFEYKTNPEDNEINREELLKSINKFTDLITFIQFDSENCTEVLRQIISRLSSNISNPNITFDISVCTSKLILTLMKVLLEHDINLRIVYSEADIYHPSINEINKKGKIYSIKKGFELTEGISDVYTSPEHTGSNPDDLPKAIIAFANFKPDRTKTVISFVDELILNKPEDRLIWIVGKPHLKKDYWRTHLIRCINEIKNGSPSYEISTFDYKETLKILEKIYEKHNEKYHLHISPLGSKMQSLGTALFHYIRPEVSIVFSTPKEYNASNYSEGCKAIWIINFENLKTIKDVLDSIGIIEIRE